jgi:hypothetical protein
VFTSFDDGERKFLAVCDIRMFMPGAKRPKTSQVTTIWSRGLVVVVKHIKNYFIALEGCSKCGQK